MKKLLALLFPAVMVATAAFAEPLHGIAMHGSPALPADYTAFPYANPGVKKGGKISYGVVGTFNNLNPFILKAKRTTARGMWDPEYGNLVYESLMQRSRDEAFSMYGLLAETVEWDEARSFIQFNLNPAAKWSDGQPVTADDVIFSFELLRDQGRPPFSTRLKKVEKMEKVGERSVRFTFNKEADREFPLILALSPVLPKHATKVEGFDQTTLVPPVGSGPYLIKEIKPGERITYQRNPDYWAKDLPSKRGFDNYDTITVEYFLQENTLFEAFKKGEIDIYQESNPSKWARSYDFPAIANGDIIKAEFSPKTPANMLGFVFNTRKTLFSDPLFREGLSMTFDFEWVNRNLFENAYTRTQSFWQNSDLSSLGNKADDKELAILGDAAKTLPQAILDGTYRLPATDGSGLDRKVLREAVGLMAKAGYKIAGGQMTGPDGQPVGFEILTQDAEQEKLAIAWQRTLKALGITVSIRTVEDAQYQERTSKFDYDVVIRTFASSLSPGIEQQQRWGSDTRDVEGSDNFAGAADPRIDAVIRHILTATTPEDFRAAVRAHDRLLIAGHYVLPLYHIGTQWVAHNKRIGHPDKLPLYGVQLPTWWDQSVQ